jgi:prevent-host-death family protein
MLTPFIVFVEEIAGPVNDVNRRSGFEPLRTDDIDISGVHRQSPDMDQSMREWQATKARGAFAEIIEAAAEGTPQLIRRRDGKEVVVVSRDYFEARRPNLRDYLLNAGYAADHDAFDDALRAVRESADSPFAAPVTRQED